MAKPLLTDEQFIAKWHEYKSAQAMADNIGQDVRVVQNRRRAIESRHRIKLPVFDRRPHYKYIDTRTDGARFPLSVQDGVVLVFSDAHFWPGARTTAFKGLLYFIEMLKPQAIICNGDAFDGASISRHPRIGWDSKPTVMEEIKACSDRLGEIESAANGAKLLWPCGNHDARFESFLAANAPQMEHVPGFKLKDHFPAWVPCWSVWINEDVVVKHRARGGVHATHNNTVNAGKTIVTGHLHSLKVTPFDDYNGTRWGVDTGTLADASGPQFVDYMEDGFRNWRSGFAVLTFKNGALLWPELAHVRDEGVIDFRGHLIDVSGR
jgi:hypothetical protein